MRKLPVERWVFARQVALVQNRKWGSGGDSAALLELNKPASVEHRPWLAWEKQYELLCQRVNPACDATTVHAQPTLFGNGPPSPPAL